MKFAIETTKDVPDESYFGTTSAGMILFRSSCMCIKNVSEGFRQIDSHTGGELLPQYKDVPWKFIKRDIESGKNDDILAKHFK